MKLYLRHILITVLGAASVSAWAQPQAPIEWGQPRVIMYASEEYLSFDISARGDTIVAIGSIEEQGNNYRDYPVARISADNGQTWGAWHLLGEFGDAWHQPYVEIAFTSTAILVCADTEQGQRGFFSTTDLGVSWQTPESTFYGMQYNCARGDTLFCQVSGAGADGVTWTIDEGSTFSIVRYWDSYIGFIAASSAWIHAIDFSPDTSENDRMRLRYSRAPLLSGDFEPVRLLNPDCWWTTASHIAFGDDGTGIILSAVDNQFQAPIWQAMWVNRTSDDGVTWSTPDTLTPTQSAGAWYYGHGIAHQGHRWLVFWYDSTRQEGFDHYGAWCAFSANNGRNWYPRMQVEGVASGKNSIMGELRGDTARIYFPASRITIPHQNRFYQCQGLIQPDAVLPTVQPITIPPDTVPQQTQLLFLAVIGDNDTISRRELVVRGVEDTIIIPMTWTGSDYAAHWTVPHEGRFWYRIEGEDFWENVGSYPLTGWAMLVTPGWIDAADEHAISSCELSLSLYPNPCNASILILGTVPRGNTGASLVIYDVLGREVTRLAIPNMLAHQFRLLWNMEDSKGFPLPSGIYFVYPQNIPLRRAVSISVIR